MDPAKLAKLQAAAAANRIGAFLMITWDLSLLTCWISFICYIRHDMSSVSTFRWLKIPIPTKLKIYAPHFSERPKRYWNAPYMRRFRVDYVYKC